MRKCKRGGVLEGWEQRGRRRSREEGGGAESREEEPGRRRRERQAEMPAKMATKLSPVLTW